MFQRNQENVNGLPPTANLSEISFIDEDTNNAQAENGHGNEKLTDKFNSDLPSLVHETRIWANWKDKKRNKKNNIKRSSFSVELAQQLTFITV